MQQTQEQTEASADISATTLPSDAVRVSEVSLEGAYDWLRGLFSSQEQSAASAAGRVEELTGTASVMRNEEQQTLRLGDSIFPDDTIATGSDSVIVILFSDGMEFRLGEEAKLLIDDFVFDQAASTGLQSLSAIKGAFAYQSGLIAANDPDAVEIKTPQGTLGIRGTKLMGLADTPLGECVITLLDGRVEVTGDRGGQATLSERFDTAKMRFDWDYVDKSNSSRAEAEATFKDLLFGGDEKEMDSFIGKDKSSSYENDSLLYSIHGSIYGETAAGEMLLHPEG